MSATTRPSAKRSAREVLPAQDDGLSGVRLYRAPITPAYVRSALTPTRRPSCPDQ
jgi:hypothetical protein